MWRIIFNVVGLLALLALIWFVGPFITFAGWAPFDSVMERLIWSGIVVVIFLTVVLIRWMVRRKRARKLEDGIVEAQAGPGDDTEKLSEKMRDALAKLKSSSKRSGAAALYDLPWYIIIGPPGTGKTTALINSELKFPLAGPSGPRAVAGYGGTRDCDWYFTEEAVLIDTAGRYTTQDSDAGADSASWKGFMDLLKQNRPRQPINGAIVCIAISDIMSLPPAELALHSAAIRTRLDELHKTLGIQFPVYVMFTKMDLVAGFTEFFGDLTPEQRAVVWGHTFETQGKTDNTINQFAPEFDALMERLSEKLTDRMQEEVDARSRTQIFGFPSQMVSLKGPISDFLTKVFEPTRYQTDAALRGIYFTSGTQEGTPFDRVLGALARSFGAQGAAQPMLSGQGKSFFINDLFKKVIFHEQGWVGTDLRHIRRKFFAKTAVYILLFAAASGVTALFVNSYYENEALIASTDSWAKEYTRLSAPFREKTDVDTYEDLLDVVPLLDWLRIAPAGYQSMVAGQDAPFSAGFGLSQFDRIRRSNIDAYYDGLNRHLLPRLMLRVQDQLEVAIRQNRLADVYEALKVYLMLGGEAKMDRSLVLSWFRRDFEKQFEGDQRGIDGLMAHVEANIDELPNKRKDDDGNYLDPAYTPLNGATVADAQRVLASLKVSERAYSILKTRAEAVEYTPWRPSKRGGGSVLIVFEGKTKDFENLEVPGFYTYDGFHDGVLNQLEGVVAAVASESWVIGEEGANAADLDRQFKTIRQDVLDLYRIDFIQAWDSVLKEMKLKSTTDLNVLNALRGATSPLKLILRDVRDETSLTVPPPPPEGAAGAAAAAAGQIPQSGAGGVLTTFAANEAAYAASGDRKSTLVYDLGAASLSGTAVARVEGGERVISPGKDIEAHFKALHEFAGDAEGPAPIDVLIERFNNMFNSMNVLNSTGVSQQVATQERTKLISEVTTLKGELAAMPPLVKEMAGQAAGELQNFAERGQASGLDQMLKNEVTGVCQQLITNRYPFFPGANQEVGLQDFGKLFAPGGIMDRFFQQHLDPLVDRTGRNWRWKPGTGVDKILSNATLREFQRAAQIRDAYFVGGAAGIEYTVTPILLSPEAEGMRLSTGSANQTMSYEFGEIRPTRMKWPGDGADSYVQVYPEFAGQTNLIRRKGIWSFHKLLDAGSKVASGDTIQVTWTLSGRQVKVEVNATRNPFTLPALREFRCPTGF